MEEASVRRAMIYAWLFTIGTLGVADVLLDRRHDGSTLSEVARHVYRTDTRSGQVALIGSWAALTAWLLPHLIHKPDRSRKLARETGRKWTGVRTM